MSGPTFSFPEPNEDSPAEVELEPVKSAEPDLDIEVVDDRPEKDRRPQRDPKQRLDPEKDVQDDEIAQYGESVQKRIKQLRYEWHEERRAKEAAQREREAAVEYANRVKAEADRIRAMANEGQKQSVDATKGRIDAEVQHVKRMLKDAVEAGDSEAQVLAQEKLAELKAQDIALRSYTPREVPPTPERPVAQQPAMPADPRAQDWASRNTWFGSNQEMTQYAFILHDKLVRQEGLDPRSDAYYARIDRTMRQRFAEYFEDGQEETPAPARSRPPSVVAPVTRSNGTTRKVQLTASQVAIANRLGVPLKDYAAELLKGRSNG